MPQRLHNILSPAPSKFTLRVVRQIPQLTQQDTARFWSKVTLGPLDACWLWTGGGVPNGHGYMGLGHRPNVQPYFAHRIAWTLTHGEIPAGQCVLHNCPGGDNPRCVNPHHLFLGTQADNVRDASRKGHLHIPRKRNRAIKEAAIIRYLAGGVTAHQVGAEFGVSFMTILRWTADQRPKHAKLSKIRRAS